jgi:hypothetical protein
MLLSPGDAEITTALERATAQRERLAGSPTPGEVAPDDLAATDPALPELPALAETPAAALPSEAPSDTAEAPAEEPAAETPAVAGMPTPTPRETPAEPQPSAAPATTAERVIDMTPAAPTAPAPAETTAEAVPEPAPAPAPAPSPAPAAGATTAVAEGEPYRVVSAVNYRAGPDNSAQRLGTVDAGRIVRVTGDTLGWKHVILPNGDRGFIYGSWLEPAGN